MNYYNDNAPFCVRWLRELIADGMLPAGDIDDRSIADIQASDLKGYRQCHFFAGIGGWAYALWLADWPATRPVWTGSCPCQPLSGAGKREGEKDERHLWPQFARLISERKPATVFGEQVASNDGREWLSGVRSDLEAMDYAVGAADLCAASVGAPHIRQRLFWVAHTGYGPRCPEQGDKLQECDGGAWESGKGGGLGKPNGKGLSIRIRDSGDDASSGIPPTGEASQQASTFWDSAIWIPCGDGKERRIKPGISPLADGVPNRVGTLRGAGNAIVPQIAARFIKAFMAIQETLGSGGG